MSNMLDWAKREVEIACKKENPNRKEGEFDYGCACYESAIKAFESLCEDGHSGFSIKMTQAILVRLLDGQPLTPIEDTDDVWNKCSRPKDGPEVYQCKRMSSLFKDIYADGTVKYNDVNSSYCVSIHDSNNTYSSGLVRRIIDEMFPITMPYMPGRPIKVYCEDFLTDTLLVSIDLSASENNAVLIVGRKKPNQSVEIVNAFDGEEAVALYKKLTTVKKGE